MLLTNHNDKLYSALQLAGHQRVLHPDQAVNHAGVAPRKYAGVLGVTLTVHMFKEHIPPWLVVLVSYCI